MKILVALSGGIDSSVVAHLLKEQEHDLIGVRFTLWNDPLAPALAQILPSKCCNAQTAARAKHVAAALGIPYVIKDLEEAFKGEVVDPFLRDYQKGLTPNPCVRCNRTIKFGRLLKIADELGCEKVATGHYARVTQEGPEYSPSPEGGGWGRGSSSSDVTQSSPQTDFFKNTTHVVSPLPNPPPPGEGISSQDPCSQYHLLEAIDKAKDQSYYLYGLTQEQLARAVFPLGALYKQEVYALAERFGVPYDRESYRESQDLCFFPEKSPQAFLRRHLGRSLRPGNIVRRDGTAVGRHNGVPLYTVGQRRGLGIGGLTVPLEVVQKNCSNNTLVVEEKGRESRATISVNDLRWVAWKPPEDCPTSFECRTRSLAQRMTGSLRYCGSHGTFVFSSPQRPQAPGQHLVLYRGEEIMGGGVIDG